MPRHLGTICSPSLLRKCCNLSCGFKGSSQLNVKTEERLSRGRLKFSLNSEPARCSPCSEKSLQFNKRVGASSLGVPGVFLGHTRSCCSSPFLRCAEPVSPAAAPWPLSLHPHPRGRLNRWFRRTWKNSQYNVVVTWELTLSDRWEISKCTEKMFGRFQNLPTG